MMGYRGHANYTPRAVIRQVSKRNWTVTLYEYEGQMFPYGEWTGGWTKGSAERKARRELAKYKRRYGNLDEDKVIR